MDNTCSVGQQTGAHGNEPENQGVKPKAGEYFSPRRAGGEMVLHYHIGRLFANADLHLRQILWLAVNARSKYFSLVKNRFLLIKCITMGALSFPTPFFIYFFLTDVDPNAISFRNRFLLITFLLLGGALIGMASYYKDSAVAALKDWYPSEKQKS